MLYILYSLYIYHLWSETPTIIIVPTRILVFSGRKLRILQKQLYFWHSLFLKIRQYIQFIAGFSIFEIE